MRLARVGSALSLYRVQKEVVMYHSLSIAVSYIVTHMYVGEQTEGMKNAWKKTRVDRMLVDHFLRAGHYSAAIRLAESSGIEVGEEGIE